MVIQPPADSEVVLSPREMIPEKGNLIQVILFDFFRNNAICMNGL